MTIDSRQIKRLLPYMAAITSMLVLFIQRSGVTIFNDWQITLYIYINPNHSNQSSWIIFRVKDAESVPR